MNIFSRRKRLLNQTTRINSRPNAFGRGRIRGALRRNRTNFTVIGQASGRGQFRKIFRRGRAGATAMPKMSSRRQFHRALRRHPAWPAVMAEAAARAEAQKAVQRERAGAMKVETVTNWKWLRRVLSRNRHSVLSTGQPSGRSQLRRNVRRNRALLVTLLAVGGLVVLLTGLAVADGDWRSRDIGEGTDPPPAARFGAATTYDGTNGEMLVFGGFTAATGATPVADNNSWGFKGGTNQAWTKRTGVHNPTARGYASMAYDAARRNVVLFGGAPYRSAAVSGETWIYNGSDWTLVNPPEPRPPARQNASMVYDAHRKVVVMFGGRGAETSSGNSGGLPLNDTWTWNGSAWTKMKPPVSPAARHSAAMGYDVCRAEAVMFGGAGLSPSTSFFADVAHTNSVAGETWLWNGTTWRPTTRAAVSPPARIGASMLHASALSPNTSYVSSRVMLYGGLTTTDNNQSQVATDTDIWTWGETAQGTPAEQNNGWEKYNAELTTPHAVLQAAGGYNPYAATPPPRAYASFAYTPQVGESRIQLFGGTPADPNPPDSISSQTLGATRSVPQVALPDQWYFDESPQVLQEDFRQWGRRCKNPVPIPPDDASAAAQVVQALPRKLNTREEIKEIGRLPVLMGGTDWPFANRNPRKYHPTSGADLGPNPNYTPAPDCPRWGTFNQYGQGLDYNVAFTHLATDPKRNRVYQFFSCDYQRPGETPSSVYRMLIQAYDGTTLKPLRSAVIPIPSFATGISTQNDSERGRFLFSIGNDLYIIQEDLLEKGVDPLRKVTIPGLGNSWTFFNHPTTGRAKLLIPGASGGISQFDELDNRVDWTRSSIEGCSGGFSRAMRTEDRVYFTCSAGSRLSVVRLPVVPVSNDTVANDGEEAGVSAETFPGPFASVESTLGDPAAERMLFLLQNETGATLWVFDGKVSRYVGRLQVGGYQGVGPRTLDPETGRLYLLSSDSKIYSGGSVYIRQGGLVVVDTRLTPVPQAINFAQFSYTTQAKIDTLPPQGGLPRRVFVRRGTFSTPAVYEDHPDYQAQAKNRADPVDGYPDGEKVNLVDEMHYKVLADESPIPEQSEISDLDALTIPVAEKPGKTELGFDAEASAYGIRLRSAGGIAGPLRAYNVNNTGIEVDLFNNPTNSPSCVYPDRELIAGWVTQVHLSDVETSARISALEVDSSSKVDLEGATSRCQVPIVGAHTLNPSARPVFNTLWPLIPFAQADSALGANLKWDNHFKQVECVGDSNQNHRATLGHLTVPAGSAQGALPPGTIPPGTIPSAVTSTVTVPTGGVIPVGDVYGSTVCNQKDGLVQGTARGALGGGSTPAEYSVGEGYSNVVVTREPARGVVVTATAVATGIRLPGISIGYIKTEAVAWSNGRPAEKRASFSRIICRGTSSQQSSCFTTKEEQEKFVADLNQILTNNNLKGKATLPTYDSDYYKGSPGGYAAGVIKPIVDEVEDQIFTNDPQREVPGLRIVFYKDSPRGFGRQVLELAGVRGLTGYGIQCSSDRIYSPTAKDCIELTFQDDPVVEEFQEEEVSSEDTAFNSYGDEGGWVPVATGAPSGLALGSRIGRFIENLPIARLLPIRAMGEALLAASVWLLLGLPLLLASQRFAMNRAKGVN